MDQLNLIEVGDLFTHKRTHWENQINFIRN